MNRKTERYYIFVLFLIAVLAFWQVSFLQSSLKYDMIDCSFPWRYIVAEHLQNGMLPLWNPYQNLGYPLFADIQSGAPWYLPVWVLGLLFGYNIYVLSFEFIFHIFMAGLGMFYLGKSLKLSLNAAFIMAVAYMLSGFFVGNAQHFTLIAGATWLPFILAGYFDIIHKGGYKCILLTAFFSYLFISGGYPTYIITTIYILALLFVAYSVFLLRKREYDKLKKFLINNLYLFILIVFLSCVVLLSFIDLAPELTRTEGVDLNAAMINPFSPQSLISLILPYAAIKNMEFYNTDMSMTNVYIGIITLIFLFFSFFIKKSKTYFFFLMLAIFSLLVAMGDYIPLRKLLYNYMPLMNMFRFPGVFRLFSILGFIVCAGFSLDYFFKNSDKIKKAIFAICFAFILFFLGIVVYSRAQGYLEIKNFAINEVFTESLNSRMVQHIVFQSFIQIFVVLSFVIALRFIKNTRHLTLFIGFIIIFEMGIAVQLNAPFTIFYKDIKQAVVMLHQKTNFVKGFPVSESRNVSVNTNARLSYGPFWRNLTIFHKQISNEGFTSLMLRKYRDLNTQYPYLLDSVVQNPPFFLTTDIDTFDSLKGASVSRQKIFFEKETYLQIVSLIKFDTSATQLETIAFKPDKIVLKTKSSINQVLVFLQNNYKGWKAVVNGSEQEIITADKSLIAICLPKGENNIILTFEKPLISFGFYVTLVTLVSVLMLLLYNYFKELHLVNK